MPWVSYADRFEDVVLLRALRDVSCGIYLDIGPADARVGSITLSFSEHGWRGINVLADAESLIEFARLRPKDMNLYARFLSSVEEGVVVSRSEDEAFLPLNQTLVDEGVETVHFLKVNNGEWQDRMFASFPFSQVRPWIVILMHEPDVVPGGEMLLLSQGYELAYSNGRTRFYLANEQAGRKAKLAAPPSISDDFVGYPHAEELAALHKERAALVALNRILSRENERLHAKRAADPWRRLGKRLRETFSGKAAMKGESPLSKTNETPSAGVLEIHRLSGVRPFGNGIGDPTRILLFQLDHIGDLITRFPAFDLLRSLWPSAEIDLVCGPWNRALAEKSRYFARILPFSFFPEQSGNWVLSPWRLRRIKAEFAAFAHDLGEYDLAIDLRIGPETRFLLGLVRAKLRAGYSAPEADVFLDVSLPNPDLLLPGESNRRSLNWAISALLLIRAIEAAIGPMQKTGRRSLLRKNAPNDQKSARLVAVAPGAGSTAKRWSTEHFVAVCRRLATEHSCLLMLLGSASERADGERIAESLPPERCRNLIGEVRLEELPEQLAQAEVFIGNDSGLSHLAASLEVPVVVPYSGTVDFRIFHPIGERVSVLRIPIGCSPCGLRRAEECPYKLACLEEIPPEAVVREVLFWLGEESGSEPLRRVR